MGSLPQYVTHSPVARLTEIQTLSKDKANLLEVASSAYNSSDADAFAAGPSAAASGQQYSMVRNMQQATTQQATAKQGDDVFDGLLFIPLVGFDLEDDSECDEGSDIGDDAAWEALQQLHDEEEAAGNRPTVQQPVRRSLRVNAAAAVQQLVQQLDGADSDYEDFM
jgi:hypothetical protein